MIPQSIQALIDVAANPDDFEKTFSKAVQNRKLTPDFNEYYENETLVYRVLEQNNLKALEKLSQTPGIDLEKGRRVLGDQPLFQAPLMRAIELKNSAAVGILAKTCNLEKDSFILSPTENKNDHRYPLELAHELELEDIFKILAIASDYAEMQAALKQELSSERKTRIKNALEAREKYLNTGEYKNDTSKAIEIVPIEQLEELKLLQQVSHESKSDIIIERIKDKSAPIMEKIAEQVALNALQEPLSVNDRREILNNSMEEARKQLDSMADLKEAANHHEKSSHEDYQKITISSAEMLSKNLNNDAVQCIIEDEKCILKITGEKIKLELPDMSCFKEVIIVGEESQLALNLNAKYLETLKVNVKKFDLEDNSNFSVNHAVINAEQSNLSGQVVAGTLYINGNATNEGKIIVVKSLEGNAELLNQSFISIYPKASVQLDSFTNSSNGEIRLEGENQFTVNGKYVDFGTGVFQSGVELKANEISLDSSNLILHKVELESIGNFYINEHSNLWLTNIANFSAGGEYIAAGKITKAALQGQKQQLSALLVNANNMPLISGEHTLDECVFISKQILNLDKKFEGQLGCLTANAKYESMAGFYNVRRFFDITCSSLDWSADIDWLQAGSITLTAFEEFDVSDVSEKHEIPGYIRSFSIMSPKVNLGLKLNCSALKTFSEQYTQNEDLLITNYFLNESTSIEVGKDVHIDSMGSLNFSARTIEISEESSINTEILRCQSRDFNMHEDSHIDGNLVQISSDSLNIEGAIKAEALNLVGNNSLQLTENSELNAKYLYINAPEINEIIGKILVDYASIHTKESLTIPKTANFVCKQSAEIRSEHDISIAVPLKQALTNEDGPAVVPTTRVAVIAGGNITFTEDVSTDRLVMIAQGTIETPVPVDIATSKTCEMQGENIKLQGQITSTGIVPVKLTARDNIALTNIEANISEEMDLKAKQIHISNAKVDCYDLSLYSAENINVSQTNISAKGQVTSIAQEMKVDESTLNSKDFIARIGDLVFNDSVADIANMQTIYGSSLMMKNSHLLAYKSNVNVKEFSLSKDSIFEVIDSSYFKDANMVLEGEFKGGQTNIFDIKNITIEKTGKITKSVLQSNEKSENVIPVFSINTDNYAQYGKVLLKNCRYDVKAENKALILPSLNEKRNGLVFPTIQAETFTMMSPVLIDIMTKFDVSSYMSRMSFLSISGSLTSAWSSYDASFIGLNLGAFVPNPRKISVFCQRVANLDFKPLLADMFNLDTARRATSLAVGILKFIPATTPIGQVLGVTYGGINTLIQIPELFQSVKHLVTKEGFRKTDLLPLLTGVKATAMGGFNQYNSMMSVANTVHLNSLLSNGETAMNWKTAASFGQLVASVAGPYVMRDNFLSIQGPGAVLATGINSNSFFAYTAPGQYNISNTVSSSSYANVYSGTTYANNVLMDGQYARIRGQIHANEMLYIDMDEKLVLEKNQEWKNASIHAGEIEQRSNIKLSHAQVSSNHYSVENNSHLFLNGVKFSTDTLDVNAGSEMALDHAMVGAHYVHVDGTYISVKSATGALELDESSTGTIVGLNSSFSVGRGIFAGTNHFDYSQIQAADLLFTSTSHTSAEMCQFKVNYFEDDGTTNFRKDQLFFDSYKVGVTGKENISSCQISSKSLTNSGVMNGKEVAAKVQTLNTKENSSLTLGKSQVDAKEFNEDEGSKVSFSEVQVKADRAKLDGETGMNKASAEFHNVSQGAQGKWDMHESQATVDTFQQEGKTELDNSIFKATHHTIGGVGELSASESKYQANSLELKDQAQETANHSLFIVGQMALKDEAKSTNSNGTSIQVATTFTGEKNTQLTLNESELKANQFIESGKLKTNTANIEITTTAQFTSTSQTTTENTAFKAHDMQFAGELDSEKTEFTAEAVIDFSGHSKTNQVSFISQDQIKFEATEFGYETDTYYKANSIYDYGSGSQVGNGYDYFEAQNIYLSDNTQFIGGENSATVFNSVGGDLRGDIRTSVLQIHNDTLNYTDLLNAGGQYARFQPSERLIYDTNRDVIITGFNRAQGVVVSANSVVINGDCFAGKDLAFTSKVGDLTARANLHGETSLSLISARNLYTGVDPNTVMPAQNSSKFSINNLSGVFKGIPKGTQTSSTPLQPLTYNYSSNGVVYFESGGDFVNQKGTITGVDTFFKIGHDMVNNGGTIAAARDFGAEVGHSFYNNTFKDTHYNKNTYSYGNAQLNKYFGTSYTKVETNNVAQIIAGRNVSISAVNDITNKGGFIGGGEIVQLKAGGSINNISFADTSWQQKSTGNVFLDSLLANRKYQASSIYNTATILGKQTLLEAGANITNDAAKIIGTDYTQLVAKGSVINRCQEQKYMGAYGQRTNYIPGQIIGGAGTADTNGVGLLIKADGTIAIDASYVGAMADVLLDAHYISITNRACQYVAFHEEKDYGFLGNKHKETTVWDWDHAESTITGNHIYLNSSGGIDLVAAKLISATGTTAYGHDYVHFYDAVLNRTEHVEKSSGWGFLSNSDMRRNDQYSVPVFMVNTKPGVTVIKSDGDVHLRGVIIDAPGSTEIQGKEVTIEVSKLEHTVDFESDSFGLSVFGFDLIGGGKTDFSNLIKPDSTYTHTQNLLNSNGPLELGLNAFNSVMDLVNTANTLCYAMQGNWASALSSRYLGASMEPKVRASYTHEESHLSYETAGPGSIRTDDLTITATGGDVTVIATPIVVSHDMNVSATGNFNLYGMPLYTDFSSEKYSVGVSVSPHSFTKPDVDVSYAGSNMSAVTCASQQTYVGGHLTVNANQWNMYGAQVNTNYLSGHVNELNIQSFVEKTKYSSIFASASTDGNFAFNYSKGSSEFVSMPTGIHVTNDLTDQGENGLVIERKLENTGGSVTSDGKVDLSHTNVINHEIKTESHSFSAGISGNFKQIADAISPKTPDSSSYTPRQNGPDQLQTVNLSFGTSDIKQINHAVIGGVQGTNLGHVEGNYVNTLDQRVETTHAEEHHYNLEAPILNGHNFNLFKTAGQVLTGNLPELKLPPMLVKLQHELGLDGKNAETMKEVKTCQTLSTLSYKKDFGEKEAAKMGFETTLIAEDPDTNSYAVLYKNPETKEAYIAFRGTAGWGSIVNDDGNIARSMVMPSVSNPKFTDPIKDTVNQLNKENYSTVLTGHSRGGAQASYYSDYFNGMTAITFDNPGLPPDEYGLSHVYSFESETNIVNGFANAFSNGVDMGNILYLPKTTSDILMDVAMIVTTTLIPALALPVLLEHLNYYHGSAGIAERLNLLSEQVTTIPVAPTCKV